MSKPKVCPACGRADVKINKEHFWPQWLIRKTGTNATWVRWIGGKKVSALSATIPLCEKCNSDFGASLEVPVSHIFEDLENGRGISDHEAELLVRWLWKLEGLHWTFFKPFDSYTYSITLRERVLWPLDEIRGELSLAISLIDHSDPRYGDTPMGLDSYNTLNAIFVAGVFSRVAIMVLHKKFLKKIPKNYSTYILAAKPDLISKQKVFFPKTGFINDTQAVGITFLSAKTLSRKHDEWIQEINRKLYPRR